MLSNLLRGLAALPGLLLLVNGFAIVFNPEQAMAELGMTLQNGLGFSSQIGDTSAVFLGGGSIILAGAWYRSSTLLFTAAWLLAVVAIVRMLVVPLYSAPFATTFIAVEVIFCALLASIGFYFRRNKT